MEVRKLMQAVRGLNKRDVQAIMPVLFGRMDVEELSNVVRAHVATMEADQVCFIVKDMLAVHDDELTARVVEECRGAPPAPTGPLDREEADARLLGEDADRGVQQYVLGTLLDCAVAAHEGGLAHAVLAAVPDTAAAAARRAAQHDVDCMAHRERIIEVVEAFEGADLSGPRKRTHGASSDATTNATGEPVRKRPKAAGKSASPAKKKKKKVAPTTPTPPAEPMSSAASTPEPTTTTTPRIQTPDLSPMTSPSHTANGTLDPQEEEGIINMLSGTSSSTGDMPAWLGESGPSVTGMHEWLRQQVQQ